MSLSESSYTPKGRSLPQRQPIARAVDSVTFSIIAYGVVVGGIVWLAYSGAQAMGYNWQWYRIPQYFYSFTEDGFQWGEISVGLVKTLTLSSIAFALAVVMGLIVALLRLSGLVVCTAVSVAFLELIRNIPLLVLLYLFYYVLGPIFGFDRYWASILCLAVFHSVLISEIFRAGINAVAKGQWEAATSIGMSKGQAYRYIILPQSIRFMLPPMTGEVVHMVKSSAIVSVIAVAELTTIGRNIISETYMSFEVWFTIAAVYMVVTLILSVGVTFVERRYAVET
ncbi:amino acid ABC transporter permease [Marivita sp.]|jgi:polar amino acid transport system permease protein|uniref:amino acid ABC transporter permease n=1 Tax=Marivita sp. TaxID=2003365 RepID=UPI003219FE56